MKACVLTEWKQVELLEIPPPTPGPGEVLLKVAFAGICGSDVHIYNGNNPIACTPVIPGHEFTGTVVETGKNCLRVQKGQRAAIQPLVFCGSCTACQRGHSHVCEKLTVVGVNRNGGFADYVTVPEDTVFDAPSSLSDTMLALAEPFSIAMHALRRGNLANEDAVLVIGAGPIGLYSALMARELGARKILISEPSAARRAFAGEFGFVTIDPVAPDALTNALEANDGVGSDLIVESSGTDAGLDFAVNAAAARGRIVTLGFPQSGYARYNVTRSIVKEVSLVPSRVCTRQEFADTLSAMNNMQEGGRVDLNKLSVAPRSLGELEGSILDVETGSEYRKILLQPDGGQ